MMQAARSSTAPVAADQRPELALAVHPLLSIHDLAVSFPGHGTGERVQAVNGVSLTVHPGQTLAVVGESGCGKSVTALSIMRLIEPQGRIDSGSIQFGNENLVSAGPRRMRSIRGSEIAMIFQEPMTSLNPVFTIGEQVVETIRLHQSVSRAKASEIAVHAMHEVGIADPQRRLHAYPHEFSGGMRQRVMIAMALACRPKLLLADEPTTALDVTIQAQILELLRRIQQDRGMGVLFITHDLGIVARQADVVCVMYAGCVMEYATVLDLFDRPLHPYTRGLLACKPNLNDRVRRLMTIAEIVNDPEQFRPFEIGGGTVRPWWPKPGAEDHQCVLSEVEPGHWVCCHATHVAEHLSARRPDLSFKTSRG